MPTTTTTTVAPGATSTTTTTLPSISRFYGNYQVSFTKILDTGCNITFAESGMVVLFGDGNPSNLRIEVTERARRDYSGSFESDGHFTASGKGVTPGVLHEYEGSIRG